MRSFMRNRRYTWALPALAICASAASAQEERVVQAFERLGAIVRRDDTKPDKPVVAVIFGLRPTIPDTASETFTDYLLQGLPLFPSPKAVKVNDDDLSDLGKLEHLQVLDLCSAE